MNIEHPIIKKVIKEMVFDPENPVRPVIKKETGYCYAEPDASKPHEQPPHWRYKTIRADWHLNKEFDYQYKHLFGSTEHIYGRYDLSKQTFEFGEYDYSGEGQRKWTRFDRVCWADKEIKNLTAVETEIARLLSQQVDRFKQAVVDAVQTLREIGVPPAYIVAANAVTDTIESLDGSLFGLPVHCKFVSVAQCQCGVYSDAHYGRFVAFEDQSDMTGIPRDND